MATTITITGLEGATQEIIEIAENEALLFAQEEVVTKLWQLSPYGTGELRDSWKVTGPIRLAGVHRIEVSTEKKYAEYQDQEELRHMPQIAASNKGQRSFIEYDSPSYLLRPRRSGLLNNPKARYRRGYNIAIARDLVGSEFKLDYISKAIEESGGEPELRRRIEKYTKG